MNHFFTKSIRLSVIFLVSSNSFAGGSQSKATELERSVENTYIIMESATHTGSVALMQKTDPRVRMVSQTAQCSIGIAHVCLKNKEALLYLAGFAKTTDVNSMDCIEAENLMSNIALQGVNEVFKSFNIENNIDPDLINKSISKTTHSLSHGIHNAKTLLQGMLVLKKYLLLEKEDGFKKIKSAL
ncbi:MAG: hypothetical protein AB8C84_11090 [Oligoflexales bacterium]